MTPQKENQIEEFIDLLDDLITEKQNGPGEQSNLYGIKQEIRLKLFKQIN